MTQEEKAKAYDEALNLAREKKDIAARNGADITVQFLEEIFPQLAESEDERIRKEMVKYFEDTLVSQQGVTTSVQVKSWLAWLEKQKDINCLACDQHLKGYIAGRKATEDEKQKELPFVKDVMLGYPGLYFYDGERMHFQGNPAMEEKQKEPHYTKRNALFDKCVENCDPETVEEVNKRVDDIMNMSELSAFEQALTNFIGDWEDDEERWPSKFVKKHGKHILDMAREELQKEQKPISLFNEVYNPDDYEVVMEGNATSLRLKEQKPAEYFDKNMVYAIMNKLHKLAFSQLIPIDSDEYKKIDEITGDVRRLLDCSIEQKPAEWSEEKEKAVDNYADEIIKWEDAHKDWDKQVIRATAYHFFNLQLKQEWSEDDEENMQAIVETIKRHWLTLPGNTLIDWLKSLRPQSKVLTLLDENIIEAAVAFVEQNDHFNFWRGIDKHTVIKALHSLKPRWKPSEEQMEALKRAVNKLAKTDVSDSVRLSIMYDNLKKQM